MIDEIRKMIELQKYWDNVVRAEKEIESAKNEILSSEKEISSKNKLLNELKSELKTVKSDIKQKEVLLLELAEKETGLVEKSTSAQNEKQMNAFNSEIETIREQKNILEEDTFSLMDALEEKTSKYEQYKQEIPEIISSLQEKVSVMTERISRFSEVAEKNRASVSENSDSLPGQVKSKFVKLLNSSNKKAIVALEKNICSGCRNALPVTDLNDLGDNIKLVSCQNCGKYIYREN